MKWIQNQQQQHLVDLEENLSQSESLNQAGPTSKKPEPRGNSKLSSDEIERRLTQVIRPKGQLKSRGLHLYDLLNGNKFKTNNVGGKGCQTHVTDFPFVIGMAMRLQGDGAKVIGKKLKQPWQQFQNIVRGLGMRPVSTGGYSISEDEMMDRLAIEIIESKRRSDVRAESKFDERNHWAGQKTKEFCAWYVSQRYKNDIQYRLLTQIQNTKISGCEPTDSTKH